MQETGLKIEQQNIRKPLQSLWIMKRLKVKLLFIRSLQVYFHKSEKYLKLACWASTYKSFSNLYMSEVIHVMEYWYIVVNFNESQK